MIEKIAFLALGINVIYFFLCEIYKTVKSYEVRKRLRNTYSFVAIILIVALVINANMVKPADDLYNQYLFYPFLIIMLQAFMGFLTILKLKCNYKKGMIVGKKYNFFVATVERDKILGYVVIRDSYIGAVTNNVPDSSVEEQDELKVTLVQAGLDGEGVIVRI